MKTPGYVRDLLAEEGIDDALQTTFIVHLLSHGRPMSEVLRRHGRIFSGDFFRGSEGNRQRRISARQRNRTLP